VFLTPSSVVIPLLPPNLQFCRHLAHPPGMKLHHPIGSSCFVWSVRRPNFCGVTS
jgi:hypothetical protein